MWGSCSTYFHYLKFHYFRFHFSDNNECSLKLTICVLMFQMTTSVLLVLMTATAMPHVPIRMDHLLALVTLDIVGTE